MRKLYTLGHSQCRLQSRALVGASSPFTHCTRIVFVLLLLLGGVMQGAVGQITTTLNPVSGATGIISNAELSITFNGNINFNNDESLGGKYIRIRLNLTTTNFQSYIVDEFNEGTSPLLSITGNKLTISHNNFSPGQSYYVIIPSGIINVEGFGTFAGILAVGNSSSWTFTTAPAASTPTYTSLIPTNGATDVSLTPTLSMTFNEAVVKPVGVSKFLTIRKSDGAFVNSYNIESSSIVISGNLVTIPTSGLDAGTDYYVTVDAGFVKSLASGVDFGGIAGSTTWVFTTGSAPQMAAIDPLTPTNGATSVALDAILTARFDQPIRFNTSTDVKYIYIVKRVAGVNTIVASYPLGLAYSVPPSLSIDSGANSLIINGESDYEYGTDYSVYIESGAIESSIGIPFSGLQTENSWAFRTLDPPAPVGTMVTPAAGDLNISILTDVVINYDIAIRNLDGSAITDANVKSLINIYQGSVALENLMPSAGYTASIAFDKKSISVRLAPGSYFNPNSDVNVVIGKVENNQGFEQNLEQTFTFQTGIYNTWLGTTDSDWTKVSNWGGTYTEGASVIIKAGANGAILNSNLSIPNVIIAEGGKLTINSGATLTVNSFFRMFSVNGSGVSASLVVNGTLSTVPSKTFIYQGITNINYDYYISSPVTGALKSVVTPAGSVFEYNTASDQFTALSGSATLTPGKGYGAYAPAGTSFSFSGNINQATSYSLSCDRTVKNYGWNLGGNPYPCAIDLKKAFDAGRFSNLKSHIYIRDNATLIQNAWNFLSNAGTLIGAEVPSMHAFWVQVQDVQASGSLTIQSSDRVHNSYNYHKSAATSVVQQPTVKLFAQNGAVKDLSVITFIPGNDDAYDDFDSEKRLAMTSSVTDLYSVKEGRRLVINSFGEYSGSKEVPIGVYAKKAGTYTLGLASLAGFDQEVELKLVDYGTSPATTHDLSSSDYSFTVAGNTFIDHRFVLQISNKVATGVEQPETNREVTIYAFRSDVVIENKGDAVGQYSIYDLSGRVITNGEVGAFSKVSVPMSVKGLVLGVVKTSKGMVNQKLLIE
ncbi:MAG: Ig-like domain-containing protein [Breznakibacter sp.]